MPTFGEIRRSGIRLGKKIVLVACAKCTAEPPLSKRRRPTETCPRGSNAPRPVIKRLGMGWIEQNLCVVISDGQDVYSRISL